MGNAGVLGTRWKLLASVLWLNTQIQVLEYVLIHWGDANGRERLEGSVLHLHFPLNSPPLY